jgi:hypothetical protein
MVQIHYSPPNYILFYGVFDCLVFRGSSSVGRASAFQAERRGFESRLPLSSLLRPPSSVGRARPW